MQNLVIDDRFAVDVDQAPVFCEEVESWQKDPKTGKELDKFNHAMAAWRYGISNAEVIEGKRREMMEKMAKARAGQTPQRRPTAGRSSRIVRGWRTETGEIVYGSVASRGGSAVELDPRFTLNVREHEMADAKVKIDEGGVDPKEAAKIEKSVKGLDQAPTVAQQTPSTDNHGTAMRDVLGPPFDSERVTLYQMRQMRKDAMIAFGLHYIKGATSTGRMAHRGARQGRPQRTSCRLC